MASNEDQPDFSDVQDGASSTAPIVEPAEQTYTVVSGQPVEDLEALLRRRQPLAAHLRGQHRHHQESGRHLPRADPEDPCRPFGL